ncbi:MAG: hypothetical protein GEU96_21495 [Propionibacteriales bacterium]|nr:hypothetical protein [Propionibacteriales bacterium]
MVVGVVASFGLVAAVLTWSTLAVLVFFGCATTVTAAVTASRWIGAADGGPVPWRSSIRRLVTVALLGGTGAVCVVGLCLVLRTWAFLVVALAVATSPSALRFCRTRLGHREPHRASPPRAPETEPATTSAAPPASAAAELSDDGLCLAWRISYTALQRPLSLANRARLVQARQEYLDEIERRNPDGLRAWLDSGARASGDPSSYLAWTDEQRRVD